MARGHDPDGVYLCELHFWMDKVDKANVAAIQGFSLLTPDASLRLGWIAFHCIWAWELRCGKPIQHPGIFSSDSRCLFAPWLDCFSLHLGLGATMWQTHSASGVADLSGSVWGCVFSLSFSIPGPGLLSDATFCLSLLQEPLSLMC